MVESIFQTLLLLAYFDIALLSITIANYAVSASYLGRESRLSRWRMERRKRKLLEKLKGLRETTQIEGIKKEIGEAEAEQRGIGSKIFLLSWSGAVILPSMFFAISFICAVFGMNSEILSQDLEIQRILGQQLVMFSSGTLTMGFMILLLVVRTVDSAARKLPIPEFDISFEGFVKELRLKRNERAEIDFCISNKGEDIAEDVEVFVNFPFTFKIHPKPYYSISKQTALSDYEGCNAVVINLKSMHVETVIRLPIDSTMPDEKKTYNIPIDIKEKKIGMMHYDLVIKVVD